MNTNKCLSNARWPNPHWQTTVNQITRSWGLPNIQVIISSTPNGACATTVWFSTGNKLIIAYNEQFLTEVLYNHGYDALIALFAHEIGHHFHGHLHGGCPGCTDHQIEFQADEFAGETTRYLNVPLHNGIRLFDHSAFEGSNNGTHPKRAQRKEAFKKGWLRADRRLNPEKYEAKENAGKAILTGLAVLGGGIGFGLLIAAALKKR